MILKADDSEMEYLEILIKYQDMYDLYVAEESGHIRYVEAQLQDKPNYTRSDYSEKIQ